MSGPLRILLGPTASGKERLALACAERLDAEIVSVDSMKIYREMDIGTAKPTAAMRSRTPHHCVDMADPSEPFSVARWLDAAEAAVADIEARGRIPVLSGGTALYWKALTEGLFDGPAADPELRERLRAEAAEHGVASLHARLRERDPEAAERIHENDLRRIVRALEVTEKTGMPISALQTQFGRPRTDRPLLMVGLRRERSVLHDRVARRVDRMLDAGLVEEARRLYERVPPLARQARQAVGYAEFFACFDGEHDMETALELVRRNTRRLVKSQMTWFRKFPCRWIEADAETDSADLADAVFAAWDDMLSGDD